MTEEEIQSDPKIVEEAVSTGWVPKEQFKGNLEKWRPAEEWVDRGREFIPFIKSENKDLKTQVTTLNDKLSKTQEMIDRMLKVQTKYSEDFYNTKLSEINEQKLQAVEAGDKDRFKTLELQAATLKKPEPLKVEPVIHDDVKRWINENQEWFEKDPQLTQYARYIGDQMSRNKDPLATPGNEYAFCKKIEEEVKKTFHHKFTNQNQQRSEMDDTNTRGGETKPKGKGWNDLPLDAKNLCNKMISDMALQGRTYTKEQYVKDYYEND